MLFIVLQIILLLIHFIIMFVNFKLYDWALILRNCFIWIEHFYLISRDFSSTLISPQLRIMDVFGCISSQTSRSYQTKQYIITLTCYFVHTRLYRFITVNPELFNCLNPFNLWNNLKPIVFLYQLSLTLSKSPLIQLNRIRLY